METASVVGVCAGVLKAGWGGRMKDLSSCDGGGVGERRIVHPHGLDLGRAHVLEAGLRFGDERNRLELRDQEYRSLKEKVRYLGVPHRGYAYWSLWMRQSREYVLAGGRKLEREERN